VHGVVARSVAGLALMALVGGVVLAAGTPARGSVLPNAAEALNRPLPNVDPGTLPPISVGQDVIDYDHELAGTGMQPVVLSLAQDLELENVALLERNGDLLRAIDHGDRLVQMQARLEALGADGATTVTRYRFDTISVSLLVPFGRQDGLSLGLAARGTAVEERHDAGGALLSSHEAPFDLTFAVRQATGSRWMLVAVLEPDEVPG
jgi:hypothetical protein